MRCSNFTMPNGSTAIICTSGPGRRCHSCRKNAAVLCDFPTGEGTTCDRACCRGHAKPISEGIDYCVEHAVADSRARREASPA